MSSLCPECSAAQREADDVEDWEHEVTTPERWRSCAYCGGVCDLDSGIFVRAVLDPGHPLAQLLDDSADASSVVLTCRECADRLHLREPETYARTRTHLREALIMTEPETVAAQGFPEDDDEAGNGSRIASDAPPGDNYGAKQASQVLGVSPRRVAQLAQDGRLEVVQERPLRVSAQSVHELRAERRGSAASVRANTPPDSVAEQVERIVALVTTEQRRAIEAQEHLLAEVSTQRDELRSEVERLRTEVERERERAQEERARADELAEKLSTPPVVETPAPRKPWWKR